MSLTADQATVVQSVLDYLQGNYEKPIDQNAADMLLPLHESVFGVSHQIDFLEGLRDKPFSTLLGAFPDSVQWSRDYLQGNFEKPLPEEVAKQILAAVGFSPAFPTQQTALEGFRDAPHSTLLKLLLAL